MGKLAQRAFGTDTADPVGIVIAGAIHEKVQEALLDCFDKVVFEKNRTRKTFLLEKNGNRYAVVVNIIGAPMLLDTLPPMHEAGVRNIIFVGATYGGFQNLPVGSYVIPEKAFHYDGAYDDGTETVADAELQQKLIEALNQNDLKFHQGSHISVTSVFFQRPHNNEAYKKIKPLTLEMEYAAFLSRAKDIGIRATGCLVVSDNKDAHLFDKDVRKMRFEATTKLLELLTNNLEGFNLGPLPNANEYIAEKQLADIVHDPDDTANVYSDKQ